MADVFTTRKRSDIMSRIRSRGNRATEIRLIAVLKAHGITGWRRNWPLFGHPDIVFPKQRIAIFVDGCFWHCCPIHRTRPATNRAFWDKKLARNVVRDRLVARELKAAGWRVIRIWQHELRRNVQHKCLQRVRKLLGRLRPTSRKTARNATIEEE